MLGFGGSNRVVSTMWLLESTIWPSPRRLAKSVVMLPVMLPTHLHSTCVQVALPFWEPEVVVMSVEERHRQPLGWGN